MVEKVVRAKMGKRRPDVRLLSARVADEEVVRWRRLGSARVETV